MFSEPLLAHAAEVGGLNAAWHPHPRNDADRDQHDADDKEEHRVVAAISRIAILTRGPLTCLCACAHRVSVGMRHSSEHTTRSASHEATSVTSASSFLSPRSVSMLSSTVTSISSSF